MVTNKGQMHLEKTHASSVLADLMRQLCARSAVRNHGAREAGRFSAAAAAADKVLFICELIWGTH